MLVIERKKDQIVNIGESIELKILDIGSRRVQIQIKKKGRNTIIKDCLFGVRYGFDGEREYTNQGGYFTLFSRRRNGVNIGFSTDARILRNELFKKLKNRKEGSKNGKGTDTN